MTSNRQRTLPFFLLTFAITWGLQLPGVLAQQGLLPGDPAAYMPFAGLGLFGPLVAATVLTFRQGGWSGVRELYAPLLRYRVHAGWYLVALVVPGALLTGLLALFNLAGREGPIAYLPTVAGLALGLVISVVEEIGWRGFALPRLQARWGAFGAGSFIGVVWYLWHLPMFVGQGVPSNLVLVMLLYFIGASLFMTWINAGTKGSLLLAVLAHLGAHLNNSHRALPGEVLPLVVHAVVYAGLGLYVMRRKQRGGSNDRRALSVRVHPL
jgi:membrane protease YdiL (CAAX protease family)